MKPFYTLTNKGRAERLRQMALKALTHYDIPKPKVRLITNGTNGIFRVDAADGSRYVMRVTIPPGEQGGSSEAQIRAETTWMLLLKANTTLPVPAPILTRDGDPLVQVSTEGVPETRFCVLFGWARGKQLNDDLNPKTMAAYGELAARLHHNAPVYSLPEGCNAHYMDSIFYFEEPVVMFDEAYSHFFPNEQQAMFKAAFDRAEATTKALFSEGALPPRLIHGDLHPWNVQLYRGKLTPIDFEDVAWGHPVQDLAIALYFLRWRDDYDELLPHFQSGYERIAPWPAESIAQLEDLMIGRALNLVNYIIKSDDPDDQEFAPGYVARIAERIAAYLTS